MKKITKVIFALIFLFFSYSFLNAISNVISKKMNLLQFANDDFYYVFYTTYDKINWLIYLLPVLVVALMYKKDLKKLFTN